MPWLIQPQEDSSPATFHLKLYVLSFLWKSCIFPYLLKHSKIWPATDPVCMSEWGWSLGKADTVGGEVKMAELCLDLRQVKDSVSRRVKKTVVRRDRRGLRAQDQVGDLLRWIWLPGWNRSIPFWTPWERRDSRKHTRLHPKSAGERFPKSTLLFNLLAAFCLDLIFTFFFSHCFQQEKCPIFAM